MNKDCKKCKSPMEEYKPAGSGWLASAKFTVTGYKCKKCGHWNDLKRRKGWPGTEPATGVSKHGA